MRIKDLGAVTTLLEIAKSSSRSHRRVIFFCACEFPGSQHRPRCHRVVVAGLVLKSAKSCNVPVNIVEWPGGEPDIAEVELHLPTDDFAKVRRGAASIRLKRPVALAEMAGLPWLSLVTVQTRDASPAFGHAYPRLRRDDAEDAREFIAYRARCGRPVLRPPRSSLVDLTLRTW